MENKLIKFLTTLALELDEMSLKSYLEHRNLLLKSSEISEIAKKLNELPDESKRMVGELAMEAMQKVIKSREDIRENA